MDVGRVEADEMP